ncbi:MAG: sodium/proton-translocating pyrophosphatase, partial [Candidatus Methylomirabilia bacterium]
MSWVPSSWVPLGPALGLLGLALALGIYRYVLRQPEGSDAMVDISGAIHTGAMVFLRKEYTTLV